MKDFLKIAIIFCGIIGWIRIIHRYGILHYSVVVTKTHGYDFVFYECKVMHNFKKEAGFGGGRKKPLNEDSTDLEFQREGEIMIKWVKEQKLKSNQ